MIHCYIWNMMLIVMLPLLTQSCNCSLPNEIIQSRQKQLWAIALYKFGTSKGIFSKKYEPTRSSMLLVRHSTRQSYLNLTCSKFVCWYFKIRLLIHRTNDHLRNVREFSVECNAEIFINFHMLEVEENAVLCRSNGDWLSLNSYRMWQLGQDIEFYTHMKQV
jgi:hypothetical protein